MKQRILTNEASEALKKFDPKYYPLLVAYVWYEFNILKSSYFSIREYKNEENAKLKYKTEKTIDFYSREDTIEVEQDEPDIKNKFEVSEKPWTIQTIFKNLTLNEWFCVFFPALGMVLGFILGTAI